jgi:hypothetical protein
MIHPKIEMKIAAVLALCINALLPAGLMFAAPTPGKNVQEYARRGLDLLMNGDPDAAIQSFRYIQIHDPQSPVGYLLEGDAMWWKIYYTTADLIDPDVFDVVSSQTTPYDSHFEDLVTLALRKSAARREEHQDEACSWLHEALAYALRARLEGLRGRDLRTARAGKKMRRPALAALRLDPSLADAYTCVGLYNYFVDTLPEIVKLLRFFIALPGGNRELGLSQLQMAAQKGELTRGEAQFLLAKDYSRANEKQYSKSLELFQSLWREYPRNSLWLLLTGSVHCRLDQTKECEAAYRQVFSQTADESTEPKRAVHSAARLALQRLHPEEKLVQ